MTYFGKPFVSIPLPLAGLPRAAQRLEAADSVPDAGQGRGSVRVHGLLQPSHPQEDLALRRR